MKRFSNYSGLPLLLLLLCLSFQRAHACSPLNIPGVSSQSMVGSNLVLTFTGSTIWLSCSNQIDVEIACNSSNYSGLASSTFTSLPQTFTATPYTYNQMTISLTPFCPGTVYKFRIRERNSAASSLWSSNYTFTTSGVFVPPQLFLSALPNIICPPAVNQLQATLSNSCGTVPPTYVWSPTTGLSNPNIANPVATVTAPIVYTCIATGGATGCWTTAAVIALNMGSVPPVPGVAAASPPTVCVGNPVLLTISSSTGNVQWQSAPSSLGPWTNISGAISPTVTSPPLAGNTCYQAIVSSCSGNTAVTNVICVSTTSIPALSPVVGCTNTLALLTMTNPGTSGTPTFVAWSPAPLSVSNSSQTATYNSYGTVSVTMSFTDGCVAQTTANLPAPGVNISNSGISCASLGSATAVPVNMWGPYFYQWSPGSQTTSVASNLAPGTYTLLVGFNNGNCVYSTVATFNSTQLFTGQVSTSPSVACNGVPTGTGSVSNVTGGSGTQNYLWTNGSASLTSASVASLSPGVWSLTVSDALTNCSFGQVFIILQPPVVTLSLTSSAPSACAGQSVTLTGAAGGGVGAPYTYSWTAGPGTSTFAATQSLAGPHTFTGIAQDANGCQVTATVPVTYQANPVISVPDVSVCPLNSGTLQAYGATTYTWSGGGNTATFVASPTVSTLYTVSGTASGCTASATGSIILNPLPVPQVLSNSPVCNGAQLSFSASGGTGYQWNGPASFNSTQQNPSINNASPGQSGTFTVKVTSAQGCTANATIPATIHPSPVISVVGSTVCVTQPVSLSASGPAASTYTWTGPNGFSSQQQNPSPGILPVTASGLYSVHATSPLGCTNVAVANVTITPMPTLAVTGNSPRCEGSTLAMQVSGASTYQWLGPNGFASNFYSPVINSVPLAAAGNYTVTGFTGPCSTAIQYPVTIHPLPVPTATASSACEGKQVAMGVTTTSAVLSYAWQGPFSFTSSAQVVARDSSRLWYSGVYTVTVVDANGCSQSDTARITVRSNPTLAVTGATVCLHAPARLDAFGANDFAWSGPGNFYSNLASANVPAANSSATAVYTVVGTAANGCTAIATASLDTWPIPTASLQIDRNRLCVNDSFRLRGGGGHDYYWSGPANFNSGAQKVTVVATSLAYTGIYTLVVSDERGCHGLATTTVIIDDLPIGTLNGIRENQCIPFCSDFSFFSPSAAVVSKF